MRMRTAGSPDWRRAAHGDAVRSGAEGCAGEKRGGGTGLRGWGGVRRGEGCGARGSGLDECARRVCAGERQGVGARFGVGWMGASEFWG
jgi:hypothetical protein